MGKQGLEMSIREAACWCSSQSPQPELHSASPAASKCPVLAFMVGRIQADAVLYFQRRICLSRLPFPSPPFISTPFINFESALLFFFETEAFPGRWTCLAAVSKCV